MIETIASYIAIFEFLAKLSVFGKRSIDRALLESSKSLHQSGAKGTGETELWEALRRNVQAQTSQGEAEIIVHSIAILRDIVSSSVPAGQTPFATLQYGAFLGTVLQRVAEHLTELGCFDLFGAHSITRSSGGYSAGKAYRELGLHHQARRLIPGYLIMPLTKSGIKASVLGRESAAKSSFGIFKADPEVYLARSGQLYLRSPQKPLNLVISFSNGHDVLVRQDRISNYRSYRLALSDLEALLRGIFSDVIAYHQQIHREASGTSGLLQGIANLKGPGQK